MTTATESTQPDADEELVERYIAKWEQETHPDLAGVYRDCSIDDVIRPYIAITREVGTGAAELAATVGKTLGWPVINRRLVNLIALNESYRERLTEQRQALADLRKEAREKRQAATPARKEAVKTRYAKRIAAAERRVERTRGMLERARMSRDKSKVQSSIAS